VSRRERINATANPDFFATFVTKYADKQYQTWLGGHHVKIGVDYDYDPRLLERIAAGIVSHFGDFSFSSALRILRHNPENGATLPRFEQVFDSIESRFHLTSLQFLQGRRPDNAIQEKHAGIIHAELFLLRVMSSFIAARRLINWGFFCEPLTILRSSLEELAWAYAVGVNFDQEQLHSPNPSKCVGAFKARFSAAGHLYGALSQFSHMEFEAQKHFVVDRAPGAGVMHQSIEFKFFGLLFYSFLLVAHQYICRDCRAFYSREYGLEFRLSNVVLPLRHLVGYALMRPELDRDEIAATLTSIYLQTFPSRTKSA
jgi:hypothetical protein